LLGYNAQALGAMALLAHKHEDDKHALGILSLAFSRDARAMAKAVAYFPAEFEPEELPSQSPGTLLSLFALAKLPQKRAIELHSRAEGYGSNYFEVIALIESEKQKRNGSARANKTSVSLRNVDFTPQWTPMGNCWRVTLHIPNATGVKDVMERAKGNANVRIAAAKKMGRPRKETT
jgi:hypothetical protein